MTDIKIELARLQLQALLSTGIHGRDHCALVAAITRIATLEAENAALRLRLDSGAEIVEAADHPPALKHWLACAHCSSHGRAAVMRRRANVHQGSIHVTAGEGPHAPYPYPFNAYGDSWTDGPITMTEKEARDLHACLEAALLQWDGKAEP